MISDRISRNINRFLPEARAILSRLESRLIRWRVPVLIGSLILFCAGAYWSLRTVDLSLSGLRSLPLFLLAVSVLPSLMHGGVAMWLLARSAGRSLSVVKGTVVSSYAYLAELLPLPGGALVRAGALLRAGATIGRSSALVVLTAILCLALAMVMAALTLLPLSFALAFPLLVLGSFTSVAVTAWLWSTAGPAVALQTLVHRVLGIFLTALRLNFAFAALHISTGFAGTFPFVLAILLGSASSFAPAGLGVSEALAALAATVTKIPPAIAFLAVGIDRLFCIAGCGIVVLISQLGARRGRGETVPARQGELGSNG
jgi:hypothetical protein